MPIADIPVLDNNINELDQVDFHPEINVDLEDEVVGNRRRAEAAAILTMEDPDSNFVESYLDIETRAAIENLNGTDSRRLAVQTAINNAIQANKSLANDMIITQPGAADSTVKAMMDIAADLREEGERQDAPYQIMTKQFQDPTLVTEEVRQSLAVRAALADQIYELLADQEIGEFLDDIALDFIPGKFAIDIIQNTKSLNLFEWGDKIRELVSQYQLMSPQEQLERIPELKKQLLEDNPPFRVATIIAAILDPSEEERLAFEFGTLGPISAVADLTLIGGALIRIASKAKTLFNLPRLASTAGDKKAAANMTTVALVDETNKATEVLGISKTTAVNNSTPLNPAAFDPSADASISGATYNNIVKYRESLRDKLGSLQRGESFIPEPIIAESSIPRAERRIDGIWYKKVKAMEAQDKIVDMSSVKKTVGTRGIEYEFKYVDVTGFGAIKGTFKRPFLLDDNGAFESLPTATGFGRLILSMKAQAAGGFRRLVGKKEVTSFFEVTNAAIRLDFADATVRTQFAELLAEAVAPITRLKARELPAIVGKGLVGGAVRVGTGGIVKGLTKSQRAQRIEEVAEVLTHGDRISDVFTSRQLRSGYTGFKFDDDQVTAYFNVRQLLDHIEVLRGATDKNSKIERGVKTIFLEGKAAGFGMPFQTSVEANRTLTENKIWNIWDGAAKEVLEVRALDMKSLYARGKRLVRLEADILKDKKLFDFVLVDAKAVRSLPSHTLHFKKGYLPRINPRGAHFVQVLVSTTKNGAPFQTRKAIRGFDTEEQANKFAVEYEALVREGGTDFPRRNTITKVVVNADHEIEKFRVGETGMASAQGLIYGPRREKPLPFGPPEQGLDTPQLGAFEAIGLYLENTKSFVTRNEWRMSVRDQWAKSARRSTGDDTISFSDPKRALEDRKLKKAFDQINEWSGFLSPSERMWDDIVQAGYEYVVNVGKKPGRLAESIHAMKHADGADAIKTYTFHATLGGLNPAQLVVQASGGAAAMSTNLWRPDKLSAILFRQNGLYIATTFPDIFNHPKAFKAMAIGFGWKPSTLKRTAEEFKRSGLIDSVLNSADLAAAQQGFGLTAQAWRKVQSGSTLPFRGGELFNRRIAFMTAVDEAGGIEKLAANPGLQRAALTRVSDLILNLGPANKAIWQKGAAGIITQFKQIMAKTLETYLDLNGALTTGERFKLFISQFALYGAAAIPAGHWLNRLYMDQAGWTQEDVSDPKNQAKIALFNGGISDWLMQIYLGADVTISDRLALSQGWDTAITGLFNKQSTVAEKLSGPAGGVAKRVYNKVKLMSPFIYGYVTPDRFDDLSWDDVLDTMKFFAQDTGEILASPFSTTRQITRAIQMHNWNQLIDSRGRIVEEKDFNVATEVAVFWGAKPLALEETYTLMEINMNTDDFINDNVDLLMYNFVRYMRLMETARLAGKVIDPADVKRYETYNAVVAAGIKNDNLEQTVRDKFNARLDAMAEGRTELARQTHRFLRNYTSDLAGEIQLTNTKVTPIR